VSAWSTPRPDDDAAVEVEGADDLLAAEAVVQPISLAGRRPRSHADKVPFDEVITSAQAGFSWAYEHLFNQFARPLTAFFRAQSAVDPSGSANDVLLRVFQNLGRFSGNESQFRAWVFTIARNRLIDEHRRSRRRVTTQPLDHGFDGPAAGPDSEEQALGILGSRRAVEVIDGLVPDQREVLMLRIVGDLTIEQIAEIVGKRPGAVKALQRRGLAAIRRSLESSPTALWTVPSATTLGVEE
jgi:RNA polymerase sigma-70 factor (ECF subfamily)